MAAGALLRQGDGGSGEGQLIPIGRGFAEKLFVDVDCGAHLPPLFLTILLPWLTWSPSTTSARRGRGLPALLFVLGSTRLTRHGCAPRARASCPSGSGSRRRASSRLDRSNCAARTTASRS